jgi:NAD(P)-dependent dehydrogenase (short-subunit alcohol dehydrogenase family)
MGTPNLSLEGQVAIVTGGGTGIGRGIALEFAKAGADVVVASRRLSVLEEVAEEVTALGRRSLAIQTDISRKTDVDNLVRRVMGEFGGIDILVNNAVLFTGTPVIEISEDDWDKTFDVNLKGYYLCSQAVGRGMVERKKGNIINVASTAGFRVGPTNSTIYSIAKAGVIMLSRGLARELASYNVRVNTIAPGPVRVERSQNLWSNPERLKQEEARMPLGRMGEPSDIGSVAVFLASEASSYMTGSTIVVDGGLLA